MLPVKMQHIMLATDFTEASAGAQAYAIALARRYAAKLFVVHVLDITVTAYNPEATIGPAMETLRQHASAGMKRVMEEVQKQNIAAEALMPEGEPPTEIIRTARELQADLVVMGTSGAHGLKRIVLGSVAETVVHRAQCAVLTVGPHVPPPPQGPLHFHHILCATDLRPDSRYAIDYSFSLAEAENAGTAVTLVHVAPDTSHNPAEQHIVDDRLEAALKEYIPRDTGSRWSANSMVVHGEPAREMQHLIEGNHVDLAVLGAHRSSIWSTHLLEGPAYRLMAEAKCPVLTLCA
ncbi:MAG: universal stress protein [Acidobacteriaceae bacterium]